ncbi:MAG: hypothetical protein HKN43_01740 [Rhodothermales bacterium]|nr:hypothetical protein [Rhodothermales bacterium]
MSDSSVRQRVCSYLFLFVAVFLLSACGSERSEERISRSVINNTVVSTALPEITFDVDPAFRFLGKFDFKIRDVAVGQRFIFADEADGLVARLFIVQFENFLPSNEETYNYNFESAEDIGGHLFRQNTWAYSNADAERNNPTGEGALTAQFIRDAGLVLEDELIMSRFLTVPDKERRHEMILFYLEPASTTGYTIDSFYDENDNMTSHWLTLSKSLTRRSRTAFDIAG